MLETTINETRTYGVELEVVSMSPTARQDVIAKLNEQGIVCRSEGYNHSTRPHWKIVMDSSVGVRGGVGFEIVSPVLKGQDGIEQIRKVCAVLSDLGVSVNKSCGMHVHHDARDYKQLHLERLVRFYARAEKQVDMLVAPSRRGAGARYCKSLVPSLENGSVERHAMRGSCRYHKLNVQSFYRQATVEFRHHQGTVDADKVVAWLAFTQAIVVRCKRAMKITDHKLTWYDVKQAAGLVHNAELQTLAAFLEGRRDQFVATEQRAAAISRTRAANARRRRRAAAAAA